MDNQFKDALHFQLCKFNIKQYTYLFFDRCPAVEPKIYSTYPKKWCELYQSEKLYHIDSILHFARTTIKPFAWSDIVSCIPYEKQKIITLAKQHGVLSSYTFIINDGLGHFAVLNMLYDEKNEINAEFFDKNKAKLQTLLIDIHDLYLNQAKHIEYHRYQVHFMLSEREKEVLKLGANGLIYRDIAEKLGITERTVKHHMSNIVFKLNVKNAKEAFLKFKELNIF